MSLSSAAACDGLRARAHLDQAHRDEMFALLSEHFAGVSRERFEQDLAEKNWVVEIKGEGRLLGFSTLLVTEVEWEGQFLTVIYSGDTIVDPCAWGSPALARTWIRAVNCLQATHPGRPCYWLLLTSGFRTYRFLPVFWRTFYPSFQAATPPASQRLLEYLARTQYGPQYDAATGLVRFSHPQQLRGTLGILPTGRLADPHVAHFSKLNPGYAEGDELVCLTEIAEANLTRAGHRMVAAHLL